MIVTTKRPIVVSNSGDQTTSDYRSEYSAASGPVRRARKASRRRRGQGLGQRIRAGANKLIQNPIVQGLIAQKLGGGAMDDGGRVNSQTPEPMPKKGLSTGAKIGIAIGAVALIAGVAYFVTKKKK